MVTDLDVPLTQPDRGRPRLPGWSLPLALVTIAVAVIASVMISWWPYTGEDDSTLRSQGYVPLVSSEGTTIWLSDIGDDAIGVTSNGRGADLCNNGTDLFIGALLCQSGASAAGQTITLTAVPAGTSTVEVVFAGGERLPLSIQDAPVNLSNDEGLAWAYAITGDGSVAPSSNYQVVADGVALEPQRLDAS